MWFWIAIVSIAALLCMLLAVLGGRARAHRCQRRRMRGGDDAGIVYASLLASDPSSAAGHAHAAPLGAPDWTSAESQPAPHVDTGGHWSDAGVDTGGGGDGGGGGGGGE